MSTVLLSDVKTHLNITVPTYDSELQTFIDAAEAAVGRLLGGPLASTSVSQRITGYGAPSLVLASLPVISVQSVTGSDGVALSVSSLDVDTFHGIIRWSAFYPVPFLLPYYTVVYTAGYSPLPADLVLAVKEMVRHFWVTQRGAGNRPGSGVDAPSGLGYTYPNRVLELVGNYTTPGFA